MIGVIACIAYLLMVPESESCEGRFFSSHSTFDIILTQNDL